MVSVVNRPARTALAAFRAGGRNRYGAVTDKGIVDLHPLYGSRFPGLKQAIEAGALQEMAKAGEALPPDFAEDEVEFLVPLADGEKIVCIGVNFPDRNEEYRDGQAAAGYPSIFLRFARSFVGHGANLVRPPESAQLDYEGEIAIVIGRGGRRIAPEDAYSHIAAITLCNEGTVRDWVRHAKFNVTQGKNWDRSGSIGPWLVPFSDPAQLDDIRLKTRVNGELRQSDHTARMIFGFRYIVSYVSTFTTLVPGDMIVCGTPAGAGARLDPPRWLAPGDIVEVAAEGIGVLRNGVEDEKC